MRVSLALELMVVQTELLLEAQTAVSAALTTVLAHLQALAQVLILIQAQTAAIAVALLVVHLLALAQLVAFLVVQAEALSLLVALVATAEVAKVKAKALDQEIVSARRSIPHYL